MLANNVYNKTKVKNSEILELLIYSAYIEKQNQLDEIEQNTFKEVITYYYQEGQKEVKKDKKLSMIPEVLLATILSMPNAKGYIWNDYKEGITKYNAEQIYRQVTIDLQQQKELDITNDIYQNIIKRQNNSKLNINGDKISGDVDLTLIGMNNKAKIEGIYSFDENAEVEFIAVEDEVTTKMCHSLNGQRFKVHDWNDFERYSKSNDSIVKYRCYGLVTGLNLPPIDDGFHWCRSTVRYIKNKGNQNIDNSEDENFLQYFDINNFIKKDITDQKQKLIKSAFKNETIKNIALNNDIEKVYIYGKKSKHKTNKIYLNAEWKNRNKKSQNRTIRHEVGHAIDYKYNYISCNGEITTALEIDKQNILKHKESIKYALNSNEYLNYAELSDILGGLTNNEVRGKYKHSNEYWKRKNALEKETFANLFAIAGENDVEYLQVINKYLPNTLKAFDGLIRRI